MYLRDRKSSRNVSWSIGKIRGPLPTLLILNAAVWRGTPRRTTLTFGRGNGCAMNERVRQPFEIIGEIRDIQTIAVTHSIRRLRQLRRQYGKGRRRKLKGIAQAELHWYEAHGVGKRELRIKRLTN